MSRRKSRGVSTLEETLLNKGEKAAFYAVTSPLDEDEYTEGSSRIYKCRRKCYHVMCNSGMICILLMLFVFFIGSTVFGVTHISSLFSNDTHNTSRSIVRTVSSFILYGGLFGLLGGISNCLILVLLFYRIPLLYGTGVIQRQYAQISDILRKIILQMLFDNEHLERYILEKLNRFAVDTDIVQCIQKALSSSTAQKVIDEHLNRLYDEPDAYYLNVLGVTRDKLKPMVAPSLLSLCAETAPFVLERLNSRHNDNAVSVPDIREAMDRYLRHRVNSFTSDKVSMFIRSLIFKHFIVLISYGCVMGFIVGLISQGLRFTLNPDFIA